MKAINSIFAAVMVVLAGESFAATRIMQGTSIMGGRDIVVGNNIYDVDFGFVPTKGWLAPELAYPGPASVFSTRDQAVDALNAIYTQLIGNGAAFSTGFSIVSIGEHFGFPERKPFGIAQLYGDMLGPTEVNAVYANFVTEILFAPGPTLVGTKAEMSAVQDFGTTFIPGARVEGYTYPVWTFKGTVSAVPEPSTNILVGLGLLVAVAGSARKRRITR